MSLFTPTSAYLNAVAMPPFTLSTVAYLHLPKTKDDASDLTRLLTALRRLNVQSWILKADIADEPAVGSPVSTMSTGSQHVHATPTAPRPLLSAPSAASSAGDDSHRILNGIPIPIPDNSTSLRPVAAAPREPTGVASRERNARGLLDILDSGVAEVITLHEQLKRAFGIPKPRSSDPNAMVQERRTFSDTAKLLALLRDGRERRIQSADEWKVPPSTAVQPDMPKGDREIVHATRDDDCCPSGLPSVEARPAGYWDMLKMKSKAKAARNWAARDGKQIEVLPPSPQVEVLRPSPQPEAESPPKIYRPTLEDFDFAGSIKLHEVYSRNEDVPSSPITTDDGSDVEEQRSAAGYEAHRAEPMCLCGCMGLPTTIEERSFEERRAYYYRKQQFERGQWSEDESPPSSSVYIEVGFPMRELGPFATFAPFGETGDWVEDESACFHLPQSLVDELDL
ncbi:hypothetical protein C8R46DRAFT_439679 [Mycena filopes]|nr:hypothetical protein C8R46DRAFT_439679 [Mycena filopes]